MMVLPYQIDEASYRVMIVLDDEALDRITDYDPVDVDSSMFGEPWTQLKLVSVHVTYANAVDTLAIANFRENRDLQGLLRYLRRGEKWDESRGDREGPYERLGE